MIRRGTRGGIDVVTGVAVVYSDDWEPIRAVSGRLQEVATGRQPTAIYNVQKPLLQPSKSVLYCAHNLKYRPVPYRTDRISSYDNKLIRNRFGEGQFSTCQLGRKVLVIGKVAYAPEEGASRVDLRTESALPIWSAMHHFDTWDYSVSY